MAYQTSPEIVAIMGTVDTFIRARAVRSNKDRKYFRYHPSEWAKCLREQQYKHYRQLGYIEAEHGLMPSQKYRLFDKGHVLEHRWQMQYFTAMGILRGRWVCQNPYCLSFNEVGNYNLNKEAWDNGKTRVFGLDNKIGCLKPDRCVCGSEDFAYAQIPVINDELNFSGSADIILDYSGLKMDMLEGVRPSYKPEMLPTSPIVADIKTINSNGYRMLLDNGPSLQYRTQVTIYSHLLGLEYGMLIYENKDDSSVAGFRIDRNDDIFNCVETQAILMQKMTKVKALPPPKYAKDSWACKSCDFASHCHKQKIWDDPDLEQKRQKFYGILYEGEPVKKASPYKKRGSR
ncbi:MAG: hypothetical protein HC888_00370 [Candidatus Competibacteraceae bacterium]|nr:hypothetical protein [Candidatus Competibacteraceae bacterium]